MSLDENFGMWSSELMSLDDLAKSKHNYSCVKLVLILELNDSIEICTKAYYAWQCAFMSAESGLYHLSSSDFFLLSRMHFNNFNHLCYSDTFNEKVTWDNLHWIIRNKLCGCVAEWPNGHRQEKKDEFLQSCRQNLTPANMGISIMEIRNSCTNMIR